MATETEIKVEVNSQELEAVRRFLEKESECLSPRAEELNVLYDQQGRLKNAGCTLRLRSYGGRSILTYKGPVDRDSPFKKRPEFQTDVDGDAMRLILEQLGFSPAFRYDKFREVRLWPVGDGQVEVCLDETPVGTFVEIEGSPELLDEAAAQFQWNRSRYIKQSYVEIYRDRLRESSGDSD